MVFDRQNTFYIDSVDLKSCRQFRWTIAWIAGLCTKRGFDSCRIWLVLDVYPLGLFVSRKWCS